MLILSAGNYDEAILKALYPEELASLLRAQRISSHTQIFSSAVPPTMLNISSKALWIAAASLAEDPRYPLFPL